MSEINMAAMNHLRQLTETIGARGSTSQKEKEAAQYADRVLRQAGMAPTTETFTSARSSYTPFALYATLLLIAELLFWLNGNWGAGIAYLTSETFLLTTHSNSRLLQIAGRIAEEHPELDAFPFGFKGAYTEGAIGGKHGFRVLTLLSFRRDGVLPEWHRPKDVIENLDPKVVANTQTFLWRLLREIDQQAGDRA